MCQILAQTKIFDSVIFGFISKIMSIIDVNPLSDNRTKWSNTLKQLVG